MKYLFNKYTVTVVFFAVVAVFFAHNTLPERFRLNSELAARRALLHEMRGHIAAKKDTISRLQTDSDFLERFAREHYQMQRKGEDVYLMNNEHNVK